MALELQIKFPLPARGSAEALRDQLVEFLVRTRPAVGTRFVSDHDLMKLSKLSRPTVRRALEDLRRAGWIERRHGSGTFVGPRAAMGERPLVSAAIAAAAEAEPGLAGMPAYARAVRLAIMIHLLGDLGHDWYSRGVLAGIDKAAGDLGVAIELLGDQDGDIKSVSRRLMQSRPDVLAFTAPPPIRAKVIGEANRLDIPCIGTGTFLGTIGVPTACEDGEQGARDAVKYLASIGHRRIALMMPPFGTPWVFERREGYVKGLLESGLEHDEGLVLWVSPKEQGDGSEILSFLEQRRPTAMVLGTCALLPQLAPLVKSGKIRVPQDLSVVNFDQHPDCAAFLGGVTPTVITMPLEQMGRALAQMARDQADGKKIPPEMRFACGLQVGESVAPV